MLDRKRYITAEEIGVRMERILKVDFSSHPQSTPVLPEKKSDCTHQKQAGKIGKETRKNILQGVAATTLFCTALCAVFASNYSRENKLSATAVLCGVTGLACSITGYVKNPYRERQRN